MTLTITENNTKNRTALRFSGQPDKELASFLRVLGFRESSSTANLWSTNSQPALNRFAHALKKALMNEKDWRAIPIKPSFEATIENLNQSKYHIVTIHNIDKGTKQEDSYLVFDTYRRIAIEIGTRFAKQTYGEAFSHIEAFPRNQKKKARRLFKEGKIIYGAAPNKNKPFVKSNTASNESLKTDPRPSTINSRAINQKEENEFLTLRITLNKVVSELLLLEDHLEGESASIIGTTLFDLEEAAAEHDNTLFQDKLNTSIQLFKDWVNDLDVSSRLASTTSMSKLTHLLDGSIISSEKKKFIGKAVVKDIFSVDQEVKNVLVPAGSKEPFISGSILYGDSETIKLLSPSLYKINDENLNQVSSLALFELSQMPHPKDHGIPVNRSSLLQEWENRGPEAFKELGFPTDLSYPYVNIHVGYRAVSPLGKEVKAEEDRHNWWAVVEHARPIADLPKALTIIDEQIMELVEQRFEVINPKTGKPKTDKASKEKYNNLEWRISRFEQSKQVVLDYLKVSEPQESPKIKTPKKKKAADKNEDYLDRVIAEMHTHYTNGKRLSKKKVEALKEKTGTPNLGALWEAVELSWLLWYKMLYREPISFEQRLHKMIQFWNAVQPTYAYSDSSKELYKQYSTPCPIGAIIAEYTDMQTADFIFEPSAGNGLLVMGANPRRTHVNEIDKSRKRSLEYQGFGRITSDNAAEPFPEIMTKVHDVVVTNPPFAKWDASKFDKERIVQKYFNKQRGVANHIRLEHLMTGLALHTMTDHGKGAIIIMGHIYFGEDGLIAKYRPFFNWLYRHYQVDNIINMNSYKLYNKQGAVAKTMLILIGGRKLTPSGVAPSQSEAPHLERVIDSFLELWEVVKIHRAPHINIIIQQLKTAIIA